MACIVVFCTTYALILPAITMEKNTVCGLPEHTHDQSCYTKVETMQKLQCPCDYASLGVHVHSDSCRDAEGNVICGYGDILIHRHEGFCFDEAGNLICLLPEHLAHGHTAECYDAPESPERQLICGRKELLPHIHSDACWESAVDTAGEVQRILICPLPEIREHTHSDSCIKTVEIPLDNVDALTCGLEETEGHTHKDMCYGTWVLTCGAEAHTHEESCYAVTYYCGLEEHAHSESCSTSDGSLGCGLEEHTHSPECQEEPQPPVYYCGLEEHAHSESCYTTEGSLNCGLVEHAHQESCLTQLTEPQGEDRTMLDYVIQRINALPAPDEIDAQLAQLESAGDEAAMMAWEKELYTEVFDVYTWYSRLDESLIPYVVNADKLLELEYIWSAVPLLYANDIDSAPVTTATYAPTGDFVKLNLYDYHGALNSNGFTDINHRWQNVHEEYPGFQWNAGAYPYRYRRSTDGPILSPFDWIANRNLVDCLDFGNSLITDYQITDLYVPDFKSAATSPWYRGNKSVSAISVADKDGDNGAINAITFGPFQGRESNTDHPIGVSTGKGLSIANRMAYDTNDYYPHLANAASAVYGRSLRYLFDGSHPGMFAEKKNTANIDGLFRRDPVSGEYYYDSRLNHAQFNPATNKFVLYDQIITPNFILYPFGNFLPLNDITKEADATQVSAFDHAGGVRSYIQSVINNLEAKGSSLTNSERQLVRMLYSYRFSWENWGNPERNTWKRWGDINAKDALNDYFDNSSEFADEGVDFYRADLQALLTRLYNIDYDVRKNFFFGMDMEMEFFQPKNGMTGNDTNRDGKPDYPMVFYFAGDDDVWVYIDNILFLDLTGIHRHVGGKIDYVSGVVSYYAMDSYVNGAVESTPYFTMTFAEILKQHGGIPEADLGKYLKYENGKYTTFLDYSTHTFNFYYMERGSGSSVCRINFNFPMLRKNAITVSKQNAPDSEVAVLGNPDYYFSIIPEKNAQKPMVGPDSVTGISTYTITDSEGYKLGTGTVDEYGIFTLKAGQSAVFTGISENVGQFHVQELIPEVDDAQYADTITINGKPHRNGNLIDWSQRPWYTGDTSQDKTLGPYNTRWYAYSSQATDASANSTFYFEVRNGVKTAGLGSLSVTKTLNTIDNRWRDTAFRFRITLDDEALPVGTAYTVTSADGTAASKTVAEAGYVEVRVGQTATIPNIISGTEFFVKEELEAGTNFKVSYTVTNGADTVDYPDGGISGIVRTGTVVALNVINSDGTPVQIPGTKMVANPNGTPRDYSFRLVQVDSAYVPVSGVNVYTQTVTISDGEPVDFRFTIPYQNGTFDTLPAVCYYRITEDTADYVLENSTVYIAEVTIEGDPNNMNARLTGMWLGRMADGVPTDLVECAQMRADFVNTLVGSLTLEKIVKGSTGKGFDFTLTLSPGTSGLDPLPSVYRAYVVPASGEPFWQDIVFTDGIAQITGLHHGESVTIFDIPVGAAWNIEEQNTAGYLVRTGVTQAGGTVTTEGKTISGTIENGPTEVVYTNSQTYVLPATGGTGTIPYTMAGLMLILLSMAYLLYKTKTCRRGDL